MPEFEAEQIHVHGQGRGPDYPALDDISPFTVGSEIVLVLKTGAGGDVVFLSADYSYEPLSWF